MKSWKKIVLELFILIIIAVPAFGCLFNNQYFAMHDDQHIARLYLLDQGIKQGSLYPRWVGELGFNFGYPLFNFYPPLVYYVAELFHLLGFSLILSIKLTFILGFILATIGMFYFLKRLIGRWPAFLAATLYSYFFYHAINIYVRGALAEFFSMAILPFVFLTFDNLYRKTNLKNSLWFGLSLALLVLTHPLIAFPSVFFLGFFFLFFFFNHKKRLSFFAQTLIGSIYGLLLSAFFWLPSYGERKYTLVDNILTKELANYKIHFIYLKQFWYSPWGYGGSIAGPNDGMTFQLGKIHILLFSISVFLFIVYLLSKKKSREMIRYFSFFVFLLIFSLFMSSTPSVFIWDRIKYLWYLQFPWRFMAFTGFFISIIGGFLIFFIQELLSKRLKNKTKKIIIVLTVFLCTITIIRYQKYFQAQKYLVNDDKKLTTFEEIAWRVSKTSFEFSPKGIKTAKTAIGTTTIGLKKNELTRDLFNIFPLEKDSYQIKTTTNLFQRKEFDIETSVPIKFCLNTFNFPGWKAYLDGKGITIDDKNDYKLITVDIPKGKHQLTFNFSDTPVRTIGNWLSVVSFVGLITTLIYLRKS